MGILFIAPMIGIMTQALRQRQQLQRFSQEINRPIELEYSNHNSTGFFSIFGTLIIGKDFNTNQRFKVKPIRPTETGYLMPVVLPVTENWKPYIFDYSEKRKQILIGYYYGNNQKPHFILKLHNVIIDQKLKAVVDIGLKYQNQAARHNFNSTLFDRFQSFGAEQYGYSGEFAFPIISNQIVIGSLESSEMIIEIIDAVAGEQQSPTDVNRVAGAADNFINQFPGHFENALNMENIGSASGHFFGRLWDKVKTGAGSIGTILALLIAFVVVSWFFRR